MLQQYNKHFVRELADDALRWAQTQNTQQACALSRASHELRSRRNGGVKIVFFPQATQVWITLRTSVLTYKTNCAPLGCRLLKTIESAAIDALVKKSNLGGKMQQVFI